MEYWQVCKYNKWNIGKYVDIINGILASVKI